VSRWPRHVTDACAVGDAAREAFADLLLRRPVPRRSEWKAVLQPNTTDFVQKNRSAHVSRIACLPCTRCMPHLTLTLTLTLPSTAAWTTSCWATALPATAATARSRAQALAG